MLLGLANVLFLNAPSFYALLGLVAALAYNSSVATTFLSLLLSIPGAFLTKIRSFGIVERVLDALIIIFFTFSSARLAWVWDVDYGPWMAIKALIQNAFVFKIYWSLLLFVWIPIEEDDE
jgi:hypothetical protein